MKLVKTVIVTLIFIIFAILGISLLKTNPDALAMFVNILNTIDKIVDVIFKGLLIISAIAFVISLVICFKNFLKLGQTATNPQERVKVLTNMYSGFKVTLKIFVFAVAIKAIFEIIIAILVHFM